MRTNKLIGKSKAFFRLHSSTILTCIGAIGVVATAISTAKLTPKALDILEQAKDEKGSKLTKLETANVLTPVYIPAIVIGASTIACIFGANVLNKQKQAALMSAYALIDNYHKEYRNTLISLHGEEADVEIRNAMARKRCDYHQIGLDVPDGKVIFYEEISGESILRYEREIMDAEYHLNRNFAMRGYATLNEFYMFLGLPQTDYGEELGWSMDDGYSWIDFEHNQISRDDGGTDIYSIDMIFPPHDKYLDGWL